MYPYYDERNQYRLPAYHRLDFAWNILQPQYEAPALAGSLDFTVYNLYGRKKCVLDFLPNGRASDEPVSAEHFWRTDSKFDLQF